MIRHWNVAREGASLRVSLEARLCPNERYFGLFEVFWGDYPQLEGISECQRSGWISQEDRDSETTLFPASHCKSEGEFRPLYWQ